MTKATTPWRHQSPPGRTRYHDNIWNITEWEKWEAFTVPEFQLMEQSDGKLMRPPWWEWNAPNYKKMDKGDAGGKWKDYGKAGKDDADGQWQGEHRGNKGWPAQGSKWPPQWKDPANEQAPPTPAAGAAAAAAGADASQEQGENEE